MQRKQKYVNFMEIGESNYKHSQGPPETYISGNPFMIQVVQMREKHLSLLVNKTITEVSQHSPALGLNLFAKQVKTWMRGGILRKVYHQIFHTTLPDN